METVFVKCILAFRYACQGSLLETLRIIFCLDTQRLTPERLWINRSTYHSVL